MKVLFTILFNLKICLIFGQSFTYDGFIFGDRPKIVWTGLMKISKVGNGNFEIKLDRTLYIREKVSFPQGFLEGKNPM